jgi:hypothetical protein
MDKSIIFLFCLSLIGLGVTPVAQAQNARSSSITIIREVRPDFTGKSYHNRPSDYRNNSDYYRPSDRNVIININSDDCCRSDNPYRYYRRGRGQTFYRDAGTSGERIYQQDRFNR